MNFFSFLGDIYAGMWVGLFFLWPFTIPAILLIIFLSCKIDLYLIFSVYIITIIIHIVYIYSNKNMDMFQFLIHTAVYSVFNIGFIVVLMRFSIRAFNLFIDRYERKHGKTL